MIQELDLSVFRFFNQTLAAGWLDPVMRFLSGNALFMPMVAVLALGLLLKGGRRGRVFVVLLALVLALGDTLFVGIPKKVIRRNRPFVDHPETRLIVGRGSTFSMPSGHAAIWGAITVVTALVWRRRGLTGAVGVLGFGVGISRMYLGVHYPTDVTAGWLVGAGYGVLLSRMAAWGWDRIGRRWLPEWHRALPDLLDPDKGERGLPVAHGHWILVGRCLLVALLVGHWIYVAKPVIELSEDEAYQWVWSKRMALSYYSKPLGIAVAHWIGTHIGGDTEFGVRFLPPLLGFILGWVMLGFVARRTDGRTGFLFVLALKATPLAMVGSILLTIDPLTVFFYTLGMLALWRALEEDSTGWWAVVGVTLAGTLLSKYFAPFQLASILLALAVVPGGWRQLRRPGPYLALGLLALGTVPILVWNAQNGWVTFTHLKERGGLHRAWEYKPRFLLEFLGAELGLLNPVWLLLMAGAAWGVCRRREVPVIERFLAAFTLPVFLFYLGYTVRARVQPNWIAAAIVPGMTLAALYWHRRWREGAGWVRGWVKAGLMVGLPVVVFLHETNLVSKVAGNPLPAKLDPLRRVRGHRDFAGQVAALRTNLLSEGKPVFIVADHYGRTGLLSFYHPGGPASLPGAPFIYEVRSDHVRSQFQVWPGYGHRKGETALFVRQKPREPGDGLPPSLAEDFEQVERLGELKVEYRGRVFHEYETFVCRGKR